MAKYNTKSTPTVTETVTHQGGVGYIPNPKLELIGLLATGIENTFYEKESEREIRLNQLITEISKHDKTFVAKALIYARTVMGQRTVTHLGAVNLAKFLSGEKIGSRFFSKRERKGNAGGIIFRLDDMLEITACYQAKNPSKKTNKAGKPVITLSNAMKRGFKEALEAADAYELAKYQGGTRNISLVDIINLVHPKPSEKMAPVFAKLMKGELKQFNTVEDKNSKAGQEVAAKVKAGEITAEQATEVLNEVKEANYTELIRTRKIGYLALLRNLRNILKTSSNTALIKDACALLTDADMIATSLVFPHQIDIALEIMLDEFGASGARPFIQALNDAYEIAIPNLTELFPHGRTAVIFDSSGSMSTLISMAGGKRGSEGAIAKAALIAATLAKGINADIYHFADYIEKINFNPLDSVNSLKKLFLSKQENVGYGTAFNSIFPGIGNAYDRVFVISDMQSGFGSLSGTSVRKEHIYSINICGYAPTSIKPGKKVYELYGYSSDIYELVKKVEVNPAALIAAIDTIKI